MTHRRCSLIVLLLALALWNPDAARAQFGQRGQASVTPDRQNEYQDRYDQERLDRERKEQDKRRDRWTPRPSGSRRSEGIQAQGVPGTDLAAVLHDIDLEEEFLMVRLRFYNDGPDPARLAIDPANGYETFFVEVGGVKRFILRDEGGKLDAKQPLEVDLRPGAMESWWAKFPALPAGTQSFDVVIPPADRFVDVAVDED